MTLEERIAKLKTSMAEKFSDDRTNFMQRHSERVMWRDAHKNTFLAGADALAEVSRLRGYLEALEWADDKLDDVGLGQYRQLWDHQEAMKEKLEALLKQMEEKV